LWVPNNTHKHSAGKTGSIFGHFVLALLIKSKPLQNLS